MTKATKVVKTEPETKGKKKDSRSTTIKAKPETKGKKKDDEYTSVKKMKKAIDEKDARIKRKIGDGFITYKDRVTPFEAVITKTDR